MFALARDVKVGDFVKEGSGWYRVDKIRFIPYRAWEPTGAGYFTFLFDLPGDVCCMQDHLPDDEVAVRRE